MRSPKPPLLFLLLQLVFLPLDAVRSRHDAVTLNSVGFLADGDELQNPSNRHLARTGVNIASENISPQKQLGSKKYWLPHSALVFSKNNVAIFSRDDNWFEFHSVSILQKKKSPDLTLVELPYLVSKLNVVVEGVPLLMVARLQATGKGGKGHVH